jgi:hypothetical protein
MERRETIESSSPRWRFDFQQEHLKDPSPPLTPADRCEWSMGRVRSRKMIPLQPWQQGRHRIREVPCGALPEPNNGQVGLATFFAAEVGQFGAS